MVSIGRSNELDGSFMKLAYEQALAGYEEGGVPVGAVMVQAGELLGSGRNRRTQEGDPIAHGEMDCIRRVGRRADYRGVCLYTTLSPCMMCSGAIVQFGIPRVVVGEARSFKGNLEFLSERGVEIVLLDDDQCIELMSRFIAERPDLWDEDIAGND